MKILSGLKKACSKRPVPIRDAGGGGRPDRSDSWKNPARRRSRRRASATRQAALRDIDEVAYVRFASVLSVIPGR